MKMTGINSTVFSIAPLNGYLPAGKFVVRIHSVFNGYAAVTPSIITREFPATPTIKNTSISISFKGGFIHTLIGSGFIDMMAQNNEITVCGLKSKIFSANSSSIVFETPSLVTEIT
jgi:hypothetical protein